MVIGFEECWPLAAELEETDLSNNVVSILERAAGSVKVKDAAGLGSLAFVLANGDKSVLSGEATDRDVLVIGEAIRRPRDFWHWAIRSRGTDRQRVLITTAARAYQRGGWPWDRAFMQAAAYLAIVCGPPAIQAVGPGIEPFPLWVALDKHTPQGKKALAEVARQMGTPWRQVYWTSFYFESARTNRSTDSPFWQQEVTWRMRRIGLDPERGQALWEHVRPAVRELLRNDADRLASHLSAPPHLQPALI